MALPWIEKYRPKTLDEIKHHKEIVKTLKRFISTNNMIHLLLYGPAGIGKTSAIIACAKELYKDQYPYMVLELNASDDRGIDVVRQKIKQFISGQSIMSCINGTEKKLDTFKLVILDEADAMTLDAQANLRRMMERYTYNARFCLICNYITKIIPAIQSRCAKLRFSSIPFEEMKSKIVEIANKENIKITQDGMQTINNKTSGDMRKMINILESVTIANKKITSEIINNHLGYPDCKLIDDIYNQLKTKTFKECYDNITRIRDEHGLTLCDIVKEVHKRLLEDKTIKNENNTAKLLIQLANIEVNQSLNTSEKVQLGSLIGVFNLLMHRDAN